MVDLVDVVDVIVAVCVCVYGKQIASYSARKAEFRDQNDIKGGGDGGDGPTSEQTRINEAGTRINEAGKHGAKEVERQRQKSTWIDVDRTLMIEERETSS